MLKVALLRKVLFTSVALLILMIIYLIPQKEFSDQILSKQRLEYVKVNNKLTSVYLLDSNDYIAKTNILLLVDSQTIEEKAEQLISTLIANKDNIVPSGFKPVIPENTKINNINYKDGLLTINFSKELLNIEEKYEEKMIEAIIYTLLSINNVNEISIYVEDEPLTKLPKTNISLPKKLDKSFGINKRYDLSSRNDVSRVTLYYINKVDNNTYYIPVTKYLNGKREKIKIIIDELSGAPIYETNLMSFLNSNTQLLNYEQMDNRIVLDFNHYIFSDINERNILEEVSYAIAYSIFDNYNIEEVVFSVDTEIIKTILKKY
jgi:germination protein M